VLDVVGLVQDWHLEYQNGPLVVVDRYSTPVPTYLLGLVQDWHLEYQNGPLVVVDRYTYVLLAVLRIWDEYPGSRILIFTHSVSRISDPESNPTKERGEKN